MYDIKSSLITGHKILTTGEKSGHIIQRAAPFSHVPASVSILFFSLHLFLLGARFYWKLKMSHYQSANFKIFFSTSFKALK